MKLFPLKARIDLYALTRYLNPGDNKAGTSHCTISETQRTSWFYTKIKYKSPH